METPNEFRESPERFGEKICEALLVAAEDEKSERIAKQQEEFLIWLKDNPPPSLDDYPNRYVFEFSNNGYASDQPSSTFEEAEANFAKITVWDFLHDDDGTVLDDDYLIIRVFPHFDESDLRDAIAYRNKWNSDGLNKF